MNPRIEGMGVSMLQSLSAASQDVLIELWEVDFREFGGQIYRFCNQTNEKGGGVVWQGQVYDPYPIQGEGFELTSQGAGSRPSVNLSNLYGFVTGAAEQFNQLVGVGVVRRQTYAKFLDAENFHDGNPTADPTQEIVSKYVVERLASMNSTQATVELAAPSESDGAVFPARVMLANICGWQYRGDGCGYTGRAVADRFDMPTDDAAKDRCSGTITGCRARFGASAVLPFGGFPSADKVS